MKPNQLIQAYLNTTFVTTEPVLSIKIGERHPEVDLYLSKRHHLSWAFITAENPYSTLLTVEENNAKNKELENDLNVKNISFILGQGIPSDAKWTPENSYLCLGITRKAAIEIGEKYDQNAIVFGEYGNKAELIVLR